MLRLTIAIAGVERDYSKYVDFTSIQIEEQLNLPSQMSFSLIPSDGEFRVPPPRAYVTLYSERQSRSIFTGYISFHPERRYLSLAPFQVLPLNASDPLFPPDESALGKRQLFQYDVQCTSDEHILNVKSVPFVPAYINRTQGDILASLATILAGSGFFDTTEVASGDLVPFFEYNPHDSFSEVAKRFGDASRHRIKVRDKMIFFQPYGDGPLGVSYDELGPQLNFDPHGLDTSVLAIPTVNDVTIIGEVEAGNNREDYFVGDGFTNAFPLRHKMFKGASVVFLEETWNSGALNSQQWTLLDPGGNLDLSAGTLTFDTPAPGFSNLGESVLSASNGIELAGGLNLEHGDILFNDHCDGILGGVYTDKLFTQASFLGGFVLSSTGTIIPSASGASGIEIQPHWDGQNIGAPVVTRQNHSYVLQTVITAPMYTRFRRRYRTIEGIEFGGDEITVRGAVTFYIQDWDIGAASGRFYQPEIIRRSVEHVEMPAFAAYALINQKRFNLTLSNTTIAQMPMGTLSALTGPSGLIVPSGLVLPLLPSPPPSGYAGGVQPWPGTGKAGPLSGDILAPPLTLQSIQQQLVLGNGFELQAAQISSGNEADTLAFYVETLPAAGTRIRLQSWEAQAAMSRIQDPLSISGEAFVVGDDGLRSAIVADLDPLPRTSEDCDQAAMAFLKDRTGVTHNGRYSCTSMFFQGLSSDWQFWPTVGRYFNVHSPRRAIFGKRFLVTNLRIGVREAVTELLQFDIGFGPDLYLEKVIRPIVEPQTTSILSPTDKANPPEPRSLATMAGSYLPDLSNVQIDQYRITADSIAVRLYDPYSGPIEVRRSDVNWGKGRTPDYVGTFVGPEFPLRRQQYDQTWYLRPSAAGKISRRSKVIRVRYPVKPSAPRFQFQIGATKAQWDLEGDLRNVYGFELRAKDNKTVLVQKPVTSKADLLIDLALTPFPTLPEYNDEQWMLHAYFFSLIWGYSDPTQTTLNGIASSAVTFRPSYDQRYGYIGAKDIEAKDPRLLVGVTQLQLTFCYVNDAQAGAFFGSHSGIDATSDPASVTVSITDDFNIGGWLPGEYAVADDSAQDPDAGRATWRKYEIFKVASVSGGPATQVLTLNRAQLGSFKNSHPAGKLYRASNTEPFQLAVQDTAEFPTRQMVYWPSSCILAMTLELATADGFGPQVTMNTNQFSHPYSTATSGQQYPPAPGMRTCLASTYTLASFGDAASGNMSSFRLRMVEPHSIRCIIADSDVAPTASGTYGSFSGNAGIVIQPLYIRPRKPGETEGDRVIAKFELINIPPGARESFPPTDRPNEFPGRRTPYAGSYPFTRLPSVTGAIEVPMEADGEFDFEIKFVSDTTVADANVKVYFLT